MSRRHFFKVSGGVLGCVLIFILGFSATGCGVLGGGSTTTNAQLRVMQASPSETSVDILIDSSTVVTSLAYGSNTGYLAVRSGTRHLQVVPTGSTTAIVDESVAVPASGEVTVIVQGTAPNITGLVLTDNNTTPAANTAQLRLINSSPLIASADVYVVPEGTGLGGGPTVAGLAFEQIAGYQTLNIPTTSTTQSFTIFFTQPGTTLVLIDTGAISFAAGQIRTLVALNRAGGAGSTFTVLSDLN